MAKLRIPGKTKFRVAGLLASFALALTATIASAQTILKIDGSTGAMPLVAALAKAYEEKTPGTTIEIGKGLGTKARIDALKSGTINMAVASHGLKVDELVKQGMTVEKIARTPVVLAVNANVSVAGLSQAQVCSIYSGALTDWNDAGGTPLAITPLTRPDSEVDAEVIRAGIACLTTLKMPPFVKVMDRGGDMAKGLTATTGAIGMTTTPVVEQSKGQIKTLSLDGIAPTEANVINGSYRLVREVYFVANGDAAPATKAFLAFVKSADGPRIIRANRAIPKSGG